jgi:hypothetical protein
MGHFVRETIVLHTSDSERERIEPVVPRRPGKL